MSNTPNPNALGADIDVSQNDLRWSNYGDTALVAGLAALQQRLYLRALTTPGTLLGHADFGMGLAALVEEPLTDALQAQVTALVADQCLLDQAITAVTSVTISQPQSGTLLIEADVVLVGGAAVSLVLPVTGH